MCFVVSAPSIVFGLDWVRALVLACLTIKSGKVSWIAITRSCKSERSSGPKNIGFGQLCR